MLNAIVVGNAVASTKHSSMDGYKLLLCQVIDADGNDAGTPVVAIDSEGAGLGQKVVVSTDGIGARVMLGDNESPARMFIQALINEEEEESAA